MRFRLILLMVGFVGVSLIGVAQQSAMPPRVKSSNEFKVNAQGGNGTRSSAPPVRVTGSASAKNLESIERQTPTGSASRSSKKVRAAALPPEHVKPTPKINFKANGDAKNPGLVHQRANPLAGRLKDKGSK
jgi:hypothetical protein